MTVGLMHATLGPMLQLRLLKINLPTNVPSLQATSARRNVGGWGKEVKHPTCSFPRVQSNRKKTRTQGREEPIANFVFLSTKRDSESKCSKIEQKKKFFSKSKSKKRKQCLYHFSCESALSFLYAHVQDDMRRPFILSLSPNLAIVIDYFRPKDNILREELVSSC